MGLSTTVPFKDLANHNPTGTTQYKKYLRDRPSLKLYLTDEYLHQVYETGRLDAIGETGLDMPTDCTYTIGDVLERDINLT
nr:DUF29 family protein [Pseudanabaena sp. Chao 1811]